MKQEKLTSSLHNRLDFNITNLVCPILWLVGWSRRPPFRLTSRQIVDADRHRCFSIWYKL